MITEGYQHARNFDPEKVTTNIMQVYKMLMPHA